MDDSLNIYLRVLKEIFNDSIIYIHKYNKKMIVLYINAEKNIENKKKVALLTELFLPLEYKLKTMWKYHAKVEGVEETSIIGEISIF